MLFPIIIVVLVGITLLLVINFAKKVNKDVDNAPSLDVAEPTPSIHEEIAKRAEEIKAQVPVEEPKKKIVKKPTPKTTAKKAAPKKAVKKSTKK